MKNLLVILSYKRTKNELHLLSEDQLVANDKDTDELQALSGF